MRRSTIMLSVFAALAFCILAANFQSAVVAQRPAPPAPNDNKADAIDITGRTVFRARYDTTGASIEADDPCISCCFFAVGQNDKTIWFVKTVENDGTVVRVSTIGSDYDTVVSVWDGSAGAPTGVGGPPCVNDAGTTELACNDDAGGTLQSEVSLVANAGDVLYIEVAECTGTATGFGGTAVITISQLGR